MACGTARIAMRSISGAPATSRLPRKKGFRNEGEFYHEKYLASNRCATTGGSLRSGADTSITDDYQQCFLFSASGLYGSTVHLAWCSLAGSLGNQHGIHRGGCTISKLPDLSYLPDVPADQCLSAMFLERVPARSDKSYSDKRDFTERRPRIYMGQHQLRLRRTLSTGQMARPSDCVCAISQYDIYR